jgi:hypothetical protein
MNQSKCILSQEQNIGMPLYLLNYPREILFFREVILLNELINGLICFISE